MTSSEDFICEWILEEEKMRSSLFPIRNSDMWDMYKQAVASFWTLEEIDLSNDMKDWERLTENEKFFVKRILAFFSTVDIIVNKNISTNFINEIKPLEAKFFYAFQMAIENTHSETYSTLIDAYIKDPDERDEIINAVVTLPCISKKAAWAEKWQHESKPFAERLIAYICVEGIHFSGAFCAIFWFKKRGLMPGLCFSNELISRDEALHCKFGILMRSKGPKLPRETVLAIVTEAVEIEEEFVRDALPVELIGMNSTLMCQYIEYCADVQLQFMGYDKHYKVTNPFDWIESISLLGKTNFFEKRVSEYAKFGVGVDKKQQVISFTEDF